MLQRHGRVSVSGWLLMVSAACSGSVEPIPPTFAIQDRAIWAGSRLVVESAAFVGTIRSPRMRLGETWLPVERVGDSSFAARVPSGFGGTYRVGIQLDGAVEELPPMEVFGMTDARQHEVFYQVDLQVLPGTGKATIFGGADELLGTSQPGPEYPLTLTDLTSGTTRQPGEVYYDFDGLRGPGASYVPGVYFGQIGQVIHPFRLDAAGLTVEPSVTGLARTVMQIGPTSWAHGFHHTVHHFTDGSTRAIRIEETEGVALSHVAGRATFKADYTGVEGLPVFRVPEGTLAYMLTDVTDASAVDFSPDGELLAVAGPEGFPSQPLDSLRLFRAADGARVAERALPASPFAVAFDPVRPLIYVGLNAHEEAGELRAMSLLVLDRETLAVLGQMSTERSGLPCFNGISCYKGVIVVSPEPAVYVAVSYFHPLQSYRFSIPATLPSPSSARSPHSSAGAR